MTLIVSMSIPDGLVIAGDSLSTVQRHVTQVTEFEVRCPHCNELHKVNTNIRIPASHTTFPYAQKVFPFLGKYGVGTYAQGMLSGKTMYFAVREHEQEWEKRIKLGDEPENIEQVGRSIGEMAQALLAADLESQGQSLASLEENNTIVGFEIVGYDDGVPTIVSVKVGREVNITSTTGVGNLQLGGNVDVVQALSATWTQNQ